MSKVVISGSDITFGLLEELMKQLKAGSNDSGKGINGAQLRAFLEHRNPFERAELSYADEEVPSSFGYPKGFQIKSMGEQVELLKEFFPSLDFSHVEELAQGDLPEGAEGRLVIPEPFKVAEAGYHAALIKALGLIAAQREFKNWPEGALTEQYLRLNERTIVAHSKLSKSPGDVWVVPSQLGMRHRGRSTRRSCACFLDSEFAFGPYEGAILMLTHPDRINGPNQLYFDCGGGEYDNAGAGGSSSCLYFYWSYRCLYLYRNCVDYPNRSWGSASGFLPS